MAIKITTLIENSPGEHLGLKAEHGLSFFIEKDEHKILFDTGQSGAFLENADQLKLNPADVDYVVLSHGHYDHSGGLRSLVDVTTVFKLILGQGFFNEKYGYKNNFCEYLGNNFDRRFLEQNNIHYQFTEENLTEIIPDVFVVTGFPRLYEDEVVNPRFKIMKDGTLQADAFEDEVLLAINSTKGLVVILGCAHPGMKNMIEHAAKLIKKPVYAILGGTHLVEANEQSLTLSLKYLQNDDLKVLGVSHCTGKAVMGRLEASDSRYYQNRTGSSLLIG